MATAPAYAATPKLGVGQVTTANTNRDGTGTLATLFTAGAQGSVVYQLEYINEGTVAANIIRFYISTDGGTTKRLWREFLTVANTPSATVAALRVIEQLDNFVLPASAIMYASVHTTGEKYDIAVSYGDF